jgi:hypothetical protein
MMRSHKNMMHQHNFMMRVHNWERAEQHLLEL